MLSETRLIVDITLKSTLAIAGLLMIVGLMSRGHSPATYHTTHPHAMAAIVQ